MRLEGCIACICEGAAEQAIMEILLENHKLKFEKERILDEAILRCRDAKTFEVRHLRKGFEDKITILRILDSRRENFRLSRAYENKVNVINIITAPEIEMLIICNEQKYEEFKKEKIKPSDFCKINLKYSNVKSYEFIKNYFGNVENLIKAIYEYKRISNIPKGEKCLYDLLK